MLLHDHLDGGLRPSTVLELAAQTGHRLPATDLGSLAAWFNQDGSGSLEKYLLAFSETLAVMQSPSAIERVAYEAGVDLARDGVVYAEIRHAPALSVHAGLTLDQVLAAMHGGLRRAAGETGAIFRVICDAMRQDADSVAVVDAALRAGVAGFDLAGPERGHPPSDHREALTRASSSGLELTIHAGEAAGVESIADALRCGAQRIGHGVRIIDDCRVEDGRIVALGPVAREIHDRKIPLELCLSSNLNTLRVAPKRHPIGMLHRAGFQVTVNTDNRLMSNTSMTREFALLAEHHRFGVNDFAQITLQSLDAAFADESTKRSLRDRVVAAYEAAGADKFVMDAPGS